MTNDTINEARTIAGNAEGNPSAEKGTTMDKSIGDGPTMRPKNERGGRGVFAPGDVIAGRYVVEKMLGEGGMGIVYQCLDKVGGVSVAVKCLPPEVSRNADEMEDIRANYRLVADLHHPNIASARTLELDESTGDYYLVMDLARGTSLKRWMKRNPLATTKAKLAILRQVAAALDYAHSRKVIHRDVKPENVMVDDEGGVKVLDFGLAAQIRSSQSRTSAAVTSRGGTPGYKSPEQWRGKPQREPADVYSFGVMAYWMFAGELPFDGDDPVVLGHAVLTEPVEPIAGLPAHKNAALLKALAKQPDERFASCGAVVDALEGKGDFGRVEHVERVEGGGNGRARSPSAPQSGGPRPVAAVKAAATLKTAALAVAALVLVIAGGIIWYSYRQRQQDEARRQARIVAEQKAEEERLAAERKAQEEAARRRADEERKAKEEAERRRKAAEEALLATERKAKDAATEIRIEAKVQQGKVARISEGDGFKARKDALEDVFIRAEAFDDEKARRWAAAAVLFTNYVNQGKELIALDGERLKARDARAKADAARACAVAADAEKYALERWNEAGRLLDNANAEFSRMYFSSAVGAFAFVERQFGACVDEARKNALPRLRVTAEIDGREVNGARIDDGKKAYLAPLVWALDAGKRYGPYRVSYESAGRRYHGTFDAVTANWHGLKAVSVMLKEEHVGPKTGATRTITLPGGATMEMIYVAPGTFTMGSPVWEEGRFDSEKQHRVTLTKGYWLGKYEVTQEQWRSVMGDNPSKFRGNNRPVDSVSWEDCQRFIGKINLQMDCGARLPTDAEWEYACRAGTAGPYGGSGNLDNIGWHGGNSGRETHPVGQKLANAWGFHDMHGNVWEWCNDWFGRDYYSISPAKDPSGPVSGEYRVLRGGSWFHITRLCRSASRLGNGSPGLRIHFNGFRLCCSAAPREGGAEQ